MIETALPTTNFAENAVVNVSRVFEPKEVKWLWYPYIPFDKVALLQGDPGDGKSKLMLSIAALLSNGERNGKKQQGGYELCKGKKVHRF